MYILLDEINDSFSIKITFNFIFANIKGGRLSGVSAIASVSALQASLGTVRRPELGAVPSQLASQCCCEAAEAALVLLTRY